MSSDRPLNLVILDDPRSIAIKHFAHLSNLTITTHATAGLDATKPVDLEKLINALQHADIISSMRERTPFPAILLQSLPKLRLLLSSAHRNASIDLTAATKHNILVTGTSGTGEPVRPELYEQGDQPPPPGYSSTNQQAWALLLSLCSRIPRDDRALRTDPHAWQSGFAIPLGGKILGLVGFGKLGGAMAKTAILGFGMRVIAWSENLTQSRSDQTCVELGFEKGTVVAVTKEDLCRRADVISLHLVLSDRTHGVIGEQEFAWMKPSALLVNTSRGPLIDEQAFLRTLREGKIRGAALDVFDQEPLEPTSPWRKADEFRSEVVLSPHMGYTNSGTMHRWYEEQAEEIERWMKGEEARNRMN